MSIFDFFKQPDIFYDAVVNDRALIESAYSCGMDQ